MSYLSRKGVLLNVLTIGTSSLPMFRGNLWADIYGKCSYRLSGNMFPRQVGTSMNHGDTGMAHCYLRCLLDLGQFFGKCSSVLFLDIVNAFASMVRAMIFNSCHGDEMWLA